MSLQIVAQGLLGPALGASPHPLADAIGVVSPALRSVLLAGTAVSMSSGSPATCSARRAPLRLRPRRSCSPQSSAGCIRGTKVPHIAILAHAAIAFALSRHRRHVRAARLPSSRRWPAPSSTASPASPPGRLRVRNVAMLGAPVRLPKATARGAGRRAFHDRHLRAGGVGGDHRLGCRRGALILVCSSSPGWSPA